MEVAFLLFCFIWVHTMSLYHTKRVYIHVINIKFLIILVKAIRTTAKQDYLTLDSILFIWLRK